MKTLKFNTLLILDFLFQLVLFSLSITFAMRYVWDIYKNKFLLPEVYRPYYAFILPVLLVAVLVFREFGVVKKYRRQFRMFSVTHRAIFFTFLLVILMIASLFMVNTQICVFSQESGYFYPLVQIVFIGFVLADIIYLNLKFYQWQKHPEQVAEPVTKPVNVVFMNLALIADFFASLLFMIFSIIGIGFNMYLIWGDKALVFRIILYAFVVPASMFLSLFFREFVGFGLSYDYIHKYRVWTSKMYWKTAGKLSLGIVAGNIVVFVLEYLKIAKTGVFSEKFVGWSFWVIILFCILLLFDIAYLNDQHNKATMKTDAAISQ